MVFVISSSVGETTRMSIICEASDFFFFSARFMVRCVVDPFKPSLLALVLESRLVLDPESNIASISTKFHFCSWLWRFKQGTIQWQVLISLYDPWTLLPFDVVEEYWNWLWNCAALGFKLVSVSPVFSWCKDRWWFFPHLSQVEPCDLLQSYVWCTLRHLGHLQCCLTISHLWLTVKLRYKRKAARWCFVLKPSRHVSSSAS